MRVRFMRWTKKGQSLRSYALRHNAASVCRRFLTAVALCASAHFIQQFTYSGWNRYFEYYFASVLLPRLLLCYVLYTGISLITKLGCRIMSMRVCADTLFAKLKVSGFRNVPAHM